jgi:hypothetical protein
MLLRSRELIKVEKEMHQIQSDFNGSPHMVIWSSSTVPGNTLEMQILGPCHRPVESNTLAWGPILCLHRLAI